MIEITGGVTAAKGYKAAGIYAGIKKKRKDIALVYSEVPAKVAGTFTTNIVKAAPVKWCQKLIRNSEVANAVILNSGVANACTGAEGDKNNELMAQAVAKHLNIPESTVLTASTGVIGMQLPIEVIVKGIENIVPELSDSIEAGTLAAEAIMTTDTYSKEYAVQFELDGKTVRIGGMAKGSGMIHPNMATMLGVVTTDVAISKELLQEAASADVKDSFNMISVDRDTSTNDSLMVLANGRAENAIIIQKNEAYELFCKALNQVTTELAKKMAADGEGATKLLEVQVVNALSKDEAVILSKSIITSNLVKQQYLEMMQIGEEFFCAMGYAGVNFDPETVDLYIESEAGQLKLVEDGRATDYSEDIATKILSQKVVKAIADMKMGDGIATHGAVI